MGSAETIIDALEDAEDYAAFEMAVTADLDATSAVERRRLAGIFANIQASSGATYCRTVTRA